MNNKIFEINHFNTGRKLTERSRGEYVNYAEIIDDDYGIYDDDFSIYDELDIFEDKELEEYTLEEYIYQSFLKFLHEAGDEFMEWYKSYSETYDINFKQ